MYKSFTQKTLICAFVALLCALVMVPAAPLYADEGDITTFAGGGNGDGGQAIDASLDFPRSVALDAEGNLYITELLDDRVRKVDTNGIINTFAGNGEGGFGGDGGPATEANLSLPSSVAFDSMGNAYIVDGANDRVRKVDEKGIITTVAGNGEPGSGGDGGPATEASLGGPSSVVFDELGNWYITDTFNNRVRKVDATGIITTIAGNGEQGFSGDGGPATEASLAWPTGIVISSDGEIYFTELLNNRVRKVDANGIITTVVGNGEQGFSGDGGPATEASLAWPSGLAFDGAGNLYFTEVLNSRIRKVDTNGIINTVAGNDEGGFSGDGGPATEAGLASPDSIVIDEAGNLYITDRFNNRVRKIDTYGIITTVVGFSVRDGGPATEATVMGPRDTAVDGAGNLYIVTRSFFSPESHSIRKVDANGTISTVAGNGTLGFGGDGGPASLASLDSPAAIAVDSAGNLYIADVGNERVRKIDAHGIITTVAGNGEAGFSGDGEAATEASLNSPIGVAVDEMGNLYISDNDNNRIRKVDVYGIITTVAGNGEAGFGGDGEAATEASLDSPDGIALDAAGNLYISDSNNHRIRKVDTNGMITTVAGNGEQGFSGDGGAATEASFDRPSGISVDSAGNLFISDSFNNRVRKVDTSGTVTTVAGSGEFGSSGDGGPATEASLSLVFGSSIDAAGNLYVTDFNNNRVRKVEGVAAVPTMPEPGVIIEESGGISEVEEGSDKAAGYTIVLTSPPTEDVVIEMVEHDNKVSFSPASVVFTAENWDQPQLIKVQAVADDVDEGTDEAYIWHRVRTNDSAYGVNYGIDVPFTGNGVTMKSDPRTVLVYISDASNADMLRAAGQGIVIEVDPKNSAGDDSIEMSVKLYIPTIVR